MSEKMYMVWREGGDMPKVPHDTLKSAQDEAVRLSEKHPGVEFHIIASVDVVKTSPPGLKVGDSITIKDHPQIDPKTICYVAEIREGGQIGFRTSAVHFLGAQAVAERVDLVERGPKVHTFEGVIVRPLVEHDHIITQAINPNCYPNGLVELSGNGKKYTLTLTEEVTK